MLTQIKKICRDRDISKLIEYIKNKKLKIDNINYIFFWAIEYGKIEIVEMLINRSSLTIEEANCAISFAINRNHLAVVEFIYANYTNFDPNYKSNYTPIDYSSYVGHAEMLKFLLADTRCELTPNALYLACTNNKIETVKVLLKDKRVNPSDWGNIAIISAHMKKRDNEIIKLLFSDYRFKLTDDLSQNIINDFYNIRQEKLNALV